MGLRPEFRLSANSLDITAAILDRFISLRLTDEAGLKSDTLEVTLADHDPANPIHVPPTGAELELWLGYDGRLQRMGLFVCDEVMLSGWPGEMCLRARAAVYEETPKGKKDLQTQKSRSWAASTKLGAMVAKIAQEHGMEAAVSASIQGIVLPHSDQTEESDVSFLARVLRRYDAIVKPAGGKLLAYKRGEAKSASGEDLAPVAVSAADCTSWRLTIARRDSPGTVVAFWHNKRAAHRQEIKVGSGEPVKQLRHWYPSADAAKAAASAELERRKRGEERLSITMPGSPDLVAECLLTTTGFRLVVDGQWLVKSVSHNLGRGGYSCDVEAERPNGTSDDAE